MILRKRNQEEKLVTQQCLKMDFRTNTAQQKAKCVTWYIETQSIRRVQRKFQTKYQTFPPFRNSILPWVDNFNSDGNVQNTTKRGRPPVTEQTIKYVRIYFRCHPRRSQRKAESDLSIPYSTMHKILKRLIHMFLYKIAKVQHLTEDEKIKRVEFPQWCKDKVSMNTSFLCRIVFCDDGVFHVSGIANTQNTRIWGSEKP